MKKATNQPDIETEGKPEVAGDDRAIMRLAIDLVARCVSEEGKVSPKVGAVAVRDGVVLVSAFCGELKAGERAE